MYTIQRPLLTNLISVHNYMIATLPSRVQEIIDWLMKEYTAIRTGQATPALLDSVRVECYGTQMSLQQLSSVTIEDARTIRIVPWDGSQVSAIERALREADLGVSVVTDSSGLRVLFPELTSERRAQLLKLAKSKLEDARISVRALRDEVQKDIERAFKAGEISEDKKFSDKEIVQKQVEDANRKLETLFTHKEGELQK